MSDIPGNYGDHERLGLLGPFLALGGFWVMVATIGWMALK